MNTCQFSCKDKGFPKCAFVFCYFCHTEKNLPKSDTEYSFLSIFVSFCVFINFINFLKWIFKKALCKITLNSALKCVLWPHNHQTKLRTDLKTVFDFWFVWSCCSWLLASLRISCCAVATVQNTVGVTPCEISLQHLRYQEVPREVVIAGTFVQERGLALSLLQAQSRSNHYTPEEDRLCIALALFLTGQGGRSFCPFLPQTAKWNFVIQTGLECHIFKGYEKTNFR